MRRPFSSEFGEAELATTAARSSMHLGVCKPFADPCGAANTENRQTCRFQQVSEAAGQGLEP